MTLIKVRYLSAIAQSLFSRVLLPPNRRARRSSWRFPRTWDESSRRLVDACSWAKCPPRSFLGRGILSGSDP